jgi:hypothetical protein
MTNDALLLGRTKLLEYFAMQSRTERVPIDPTPPDVQVDVRGLLISDRLYEECTARRAINICMWDKRPGDYNYNLDAFAKKIGLDFEIDLLVVFTDLQRDKDLPVL